MFFNYLIFLKMFLLPLIKIILIFFFQDLKKPVVLLLNKIDLAPPDVCVAWRHYLQDKFPLLEIVLYSTDSKNFSTETDESDMLRLNTLDVRKVKTGRKKPTRSSYKAPIGLKVSCIAWRFYFL